jgi:hypothetical protein
MTHESHEPHRWRASRHGLSFGALRVSFQRFVSRGVPIVTRAATSLGVLPVGTAADMFVLPLGAEEGFWLGIEIPPDSRAEAIRIEAIRTGGERVRIAELINLEVAILCGIPLTDGRFEVFTRDSVKELEFRVGTARARVRPADPATYMSQTGEPAPPTLDESAGYGGWELP